MSTELVMLFNHLILCHPLLLLPSIFPSIRVFSNEWALHIKWSKDWSFRICPSNEYSGSTSSRIDCFVVVQLLSRVQLFVTPWAAVHQASLSSTISQSLPKLMSIALVCHPTISSSVAPFSSCPQSFPASGSALHINHRKLTKMIKWTTALCNLMKL